MEPIVEASQLNKAYDGRVVLDVEHLAVDPGEILVFLGPSGAGKSVLLRLLNLLEPPTSGEIMFKGEDVSSVAGSHGLEVRRRMVMLFQDPLLFKISVEKNVAFGLGVRRLPQQEIKRRVDEALELLGLTGLNAKDVATLSGGEAQRVAFARALVVEPEIIYLDEPFSDLDFLIRRRLQSEVRDIFKEKGLTSVFVTHDHEEAARMGDRIMVLNEGKIVQAGTPRQVFQQPESEFVARFVGMENIYGGTVVSSEGGLVEVTVDGEIIEVVTDSRAGEAVTVGLRPEDVTLVPAAEVDSRASSRNALVGRVSRVEAQGPTAYVTVDCPFPVRALITSRSLEELGLEVGSDAGVRFKATAVHVI
ncbi:MAG: ABC transporter ATP-binding protein [Actinobacteria bacterium]|nr:ABC transporter ATP-binding protein [Actinomycetota bacterium]